MASTQWYRRIEVKKNGKRKRSLINIRNITIIIITIPTSISDPKDEEIYNISWWHQQGPHVVGGTVWVRRGGYAVVFCELTVERVELEERSRWVVSSCLQETLDQICVSEGWEVHPMLRWRPLFFIFYFLSWSDRQEGKTVVSFSSSELLLWLESTCQKEVKKKKNK